SIGAHAPEVGEAQRAELAYSAAPCSRPAPSCGEGRAEPAVVVMCGLPATGKSTVAGTLAGRIGGGYVSSDIVRKQLAGIDPRERTDEAFRAGLYSPEMTERTYTELRRHVREHLDAGRAVVIDAMHGRASEREAARELAAEHGVPCLVAELHLDEATARARIAGREDDPLRTSDATEDVYALQRDRFEPVGSGEGPSITLDASRPPGALARDIAEALAGLRA
ncbi:MAG: AAA family ATPase, partial [Chloroflexi bacterium]|nr:AAA family ATPase [Chloroflexota bacterium]